MNTEVLGGARAVASHRGEQCCIRLAPPREQSPQRTPPPFPSPPPGGARRLHGVVTPRVLNSLQKSCLHDGLDVHVSKQHTNSRGLSPNGIAPALCHVSTSPSSGSCCCPSALDTAVLRRQDGEGPPAPRAGGGGSVSPHLGGGGAKGISRSSRPPAPVSTHSAWTDWGEGPAVL